MFGAGSLSRRLILGAGVFITAALVVAGVVILFALHRFVQGQIDQRLDSQILFLSSTLQMNNDGTIALTGAADGPPFDRMRHGWYWQIIGPKNVLTSRSLREAKLEIPDLSNRPPPPPPPPPPRDSHDDRPPPPGERPRPADGPGPDGDPLHFRIFNVTRGGAEVTIVATAPRDAVLGPLRSAMTTLAISLVALAIALVAAMLLQVRLGLRPLEDLRRAVADVRSGRIRAVPDDQPREIAPLVSELNTLLRQNAANLERARRHVANLAHGLKTPLATLAIALPKDGARAHELRRLVETMEHRIRHHLGRARIAALGEPVNAQTQLAPRASDLGTVLCKINIERAIAFKGAIPDGLAVACEPQDVDEMLGNLMENAFRWARSKVEVSANSDDSEHVVIFIDDDGPGLQASDLTKALQVGQRLDETTSGFGFGLPIARELAELYGGSLDFAQSPYGGLRVAVRLPHSR
jgi:signal transduction histidine kinase